MKKLLLVALIAAVMLTGCVVPPLKMNVQYPDTSPQILVRYDWVKPMGPYGTYIKDDKVQFAQDVNRILNGQLHPGPHEKLLVRVRKVGYFSDTLIAVDIQTEMDVTLQTDGTTHTKVFTDKATSNSTNVDDIMRAVRDSVQRVLDQVVGFVRATRAKAQ